LTFQNIVFVGGAPVGGNACIVEGGSTVISTNITFTDCTFIPPDTNHTKALVYVAGTTNGGSPNTGVSANWTFDRCRFLRTQQKCIACSVPMSDAAYSFGLTVQNCLFIGGGEQDGTSSGACVSLVSSGLLTFYGGDFKILNCTAVGGGAFVRTSGVSTTNRVESSTVP
jgi:hypothetical protein